MSFTKQSVCLFKTGGQKSYDVPEKPGNELDYIIKATLFK